MDDDASSFAAELSCEKCGTTGPHHLLYAGRLLVLTRCEQCGAEHRHDNGSLRAAYVQDLEQRLTSKPGRMARRLAHDPVHFLLSLPRTVARKPGRMISELRTLRRP